MGVKLGTVGQSSASGRDGSRVNVVHFRVMPRRTREQWLEMIQRTRPTVFAVSALEAELERNLGTDGLSDSDVNEIRASLEKLVLEAQPVRAALAPTERLQAAIEYRPNGSGGRGRLFIEIEGRAQLEPLETLTPQIGVLDEFKVYIMTDGSAFAGLQVDDATELPARSEGARAALDALDLPAVDCSEANLQSASVSDVLSWALEHRVLAGR